MRIPPPPAVAAAEQRIAAAKKVLDDAGLRIMYPEMFPAPPNGKTYLQLLSDLVPVLATDAELAQWNQQEPEYGNIACEHVWREFESQDERSVRCTLCGVVGEIDDTVDGGVFYPAT